MGVQSQHIVKKKENFTGLPNKADRGILYINDVFLKLILFVRSTFFKYYINKLVEELSPANLPLHIGVC